MKIIKQVFILLIIFALWSCHTPDKNLIVGKYGIDKYRLRDDSVKVEEYKFLVVKNDESFELFNNKSNIKGKWSVDNLSYKKNNNGASELRGTITFLLNNKSVQAELKGNIIEFSYPNDFYSGRFKSLLYVKLNR